ncbi:hypothetical protein [Saccharopolyspora oryzae]|uniref:Uncharacterized protein n=1 Tax=Saccharopolyspora oryzae TaxID=2997343 RepID=A0ABT4URU2_9PSEU|nr:hypothetical protein [Saccharopolyspora oryzae]MDA3623814.1 hypothetical protein [Saccharopolyspora oryzae]
MATLGRASARTRKFLARSAGWLREAAGRIVRDLLVRLYRKVPAWLDKLADSASGSPSVQSGLAGVSAAMRGKHPLWPAVKAAVAGLSVKVKVLLVLGLALALLLGPVLLVLLLVFLVIAVIKTMRLRHSEEFVTSRW